VSTPAYVVTPPSGTGRGVLVLHAWWGLTAAVKARCDALADAGFTALAPDLLGATATSLDEAERLLGERDANQLAMGVLSTLRALREMPATPDEPIAILGHGMGGSLALWASEREPDSVRAVVSYYGSQGIDFVDTRAAYLIHLAEHDDLVDPDELAMMEATMHLAEASVEVVTYPGTSHGFADEDSGVADPAASARAWDRTLSFLTQPA
jgi:carboxymethylenebutenolidase